MHTVRALLLAIALAATACSSESDTAAEAEPPTTTTVETPAAPVTEPTETDDDAEPAAVEAEGGLVETFLQDRLGDIRIPADLGSVVVALVEADGSIVQASRTSGTDTPPVDADDLFRVGSITKVFTSTLTLMLVEDGLVDLDAPASDYITRVAVPGDVTVRHLLGHRSGIASYTDVAGFFVEVGLDDDRIWIPEEMIAAVADEPAGFEPGTEFYYSNTNFILLGILIEEVVGETYDDTLRSRILEPLGMPDTYVDGVEDGADVAFSYTGFFTGPLEPITADYTGIATSAWSAGALVSTPADLHLFFTALFGGELINDDLRDEMTAAAEGYGLGIEVNPRDIGEGLFGHGGSIMGFNTMVMHAPETGRTGFWAATSDAIDPRPAAFAAAPLLLEASLEEGVVSASDDDATGASDEADPGIVADLTAYIVAYYTGDTEAAWNGASERCQGIAGREFLDATVVQYTGLAPGAIVSDISTLVNGDRALVTYNVLYADGELFDAFDSQLWLFADGNWHQNAC